MKTLFLISAILFIAPYGWADADTDMLLSPTITNPESHARLQEIENQCKGKDGCETLIGDMNTKASFGEMPSLDQCPGKGCPVCNESEVCKELVIKMKAVASATSKATSEATAKTLKDDAVANKKQSGSAKKGE